MGSRARQFHTYLVHGGSAICHREKGRTLCFRLVYRRTRGRWETERETKRDGDSERDRGRERDRETETETDRQTDRDRGRDRELTVKIVCIDFYQCHYVLALISLTRKLMVIAPDHRFDISLHR